MAFSTEAKKQRAAYMVAYRAKNREKVLENQRAYYQAHKDKFKQYRENYWNKRAKATAEQSVDENVKMGD